MEETRQAPEETAAEERERFRQSVAGFAADAPTA